MTQSDDWVPGMEPRKEYTHKPGYRCNCHSIYTEGDEVWSTSGTIGGKPAVWLECATCGNLFGGLTLDRENRSILKEMED